MKVVGLGAGGHASVVLEAIRRAGEHEVVGFVERDRMPDSAKIAGVPIIATDAEMASLRERGVAGFFVGAGSVGDASLRVRLFELGCAAGLDAITVVDPTAHVSTQASVGAGSVLLVGAIVNPSVTIGVNVIVNSGAIIEHDCILHDHVHVAPGARLGGNAVVGRGAHVGIGATVMQGVRIGSGAVVGAGAVVVKDVAAQTVVVGVPAAPHARGKGATKRGES